MPKYKCQKCSKECGVWYYDEVTKTWLCQKCAYDKKTTKEIKKEVKTN